jgi:tetratricopeptide (TPR) repeat protein
MNDRIEEAQSVLSRSINANPGNWFLHYAQGDLWLLKRDIPSALQSFQRAASLNPNDVNLALNLAKRLEQAGLTREAGEQYLRAYRLAPKAMPVVNEAAWFFIDTVNTPSRPRRWSSS